MPLHLLIKYKLKYRQQDINLVRRINSYLISCLWENYVQQAISQILILKFKEMKSIITIRNAGKHQDVEHSTANLKYSLSFNLFNKLKWISFVIVFVVYQMPFAQTIFNQPIQLPGTPFSPSFPEVLTIDPPGNVFRTPYFPLPSAGLDTPSLFWNPNTGSWISNSNLRILPPLSAIFPSSLSETFYFRGTAPSNNVPLLVEGNVGTNQGTVGTFGQAVSNARWNALGDRIPFSTTPNPYIRVTGFRSTWNEFGVNVGMADRYTSGSIKDALISWQDATAGNPIAASNRLVFGVRDGSTTNFQELGQFASNGSFGIGFNNAVPGFQITLNDKLNLYGNYSTDNLFMSWSDIPTGVPLVNFRNSRIGINANSENLEIRNERSANIEFWTDGATATNPRMTIDFTGVVRIGTPVTIPLTFNQSNPGVGWNPPLPATPSPIFSVGGGDIECDQNLFLTGDVFIQSDRRIKSNITELPDWKRILSLNAFSYNYVDRNNDKLSFGFIAQDVLEVLPELTSSWREGGAVNYIGFIPFLTQGIKEHEEKLAKLDLDQSIAHFKEIEEKLLANNEKLQKESLEFFLKIESLENENQILESRLAELERKFVTIYELPYFQGNIQQEVKSNRLGQTGTLTQPPSLEQNEPNPFTSLTVIRYFIPEGVGSFRIEVRNTENKIVGSFPVNAVGHGNITISAGTLAAGTYYYSLIINNQVFDTKKMVLVN